MKKPLFVMAQECKLGKKQFMDKPTLKWLEQKVKPKFLNVREIQPNFEPLDEVLFRKLLIKKNFSGIHGTGHMGRVILISYVLSKIEGRKDYFPQIMAAAVHDIGRKSDKGDEGHGIRSAKWFIKSNNKLKERLSKREIKDIATAVRLHELDSSQLDKDHIYLDILKAADALDRFRLPKEKWWPDLNRIALEVSPRLLALCKYLTIESEKKIIYERKSPEDALVAVGIKTGILKAKVYKIHRAIFSMIPKYQIVLSAVIFNKEGQFLLGKRSLSEDILPGYWGLPGGKMEADSDSKDTLESELRREVKEEVNLEIDKLKFIENHLHAESRKIHICFCCDIKSGKPKALDETEEVGWFSLESAKKLKLTPFVLERLERAIKLRKNEKE